MGLPDGLWAFRGFVLSSVKREIQAKYRNSLFGFAWMIIQPLSMIVVYTVIFSQLMGSRLPGVSGNFAYSIYLCAGILTWGLFAEITQRMVGVFVDNANLIKKLSFPRLCLPLIVVLSASFNFCIILALFLVFLLVSGNFPGWSLLAMLPLLLVQLMLATGLGGILGVLNVFFRDVGQMFGVLIQFWFWFTPIIYPFSILPDWAATLMRLNPLLSLMEGYQGIMVRGLWPDWEQLAPTALLALVLCAYAVVLFRKHAGDMVDEL
ncbi:ABC transporter permease [Pseudidiomarina sp.]|uniref:ABC transporter permease n=1 Tax=Pseudidiomarina sp. TaxID=2081707 RepID=UPI003A987F63